jgi:hypothetical protein
MASAPVSGLGVETTNHGPPGRDCGYSGQPSSAAPKDSLVDGVDVDSGPEFVVAIALLTLLAVT